MNIFKTIFFLCCVVSIHAVAGAVEGCSSLGCTAKVENVYLNPNGTIQITLDSSINKSPLECTLNGGYFTLKPNNIHFDQMYSMVLSAHLGQKLINLRAIQNSPDCEIWYSVIY